MNPKKPLIRPALESDLQSALRLMTELGYRDLSSEQFGETYLTVLKDPAGRLIVAEDENGEVVGLATISSRPQLRLNGNLVTIDELVVADHARGKGIGRELLKAAEAVARKLGARRLELETSRARESYRRGFYVKNGFAEADSAVMRIDFTTSAGA